MLKEGERRISTLPERRVTPQRCLPVKPASFREHIQGNLEICYTVLGSNMKYGLQWFLPIMIFLGQRGRCGPKYSFLCSSLFFQLLSWFYLSILFLPSFLSPLFSSLSWKCPRGRGSLDLKMRWLARVWSHLKTTEVPTCHTNAAQLLYCPPSSSIILQTLRGAVAIW